VFESLIAKQIFFSPLKHYKTTLSATSFLANLITGGRPIANPAFKPSIKPGHVTRVIS